MKTVYHPTLDASCDVEDEKVPDWLASGWLASPRGSTPADEGSTTKAALQAKAESLGLSIKGTKADIEQRIAAAQQ